MTYRHGAISRSFLVDSFLIGLSTLWYATQAGRVGENQADKTPINCHLHPIDKTIDTAPF